MKGTLAQVERHIVDATSAKWPVGSRWIRRDGSVIEILRIDPGSHSDDPDAIGTADLHRVIAVPTYTDGTRLWSGAPTLAEDVDRSRFLAPAATDVLERIE